MKVYKVSDCDWFAADSPQQARDAYIKYVGDDDNAFDLCDVKEVSPESMERLRVDSEDIPAGTFTFKHFLELMSKNTTEPFFFASTEY